MTLNLRSLTPRHNDEAAYSRGHSLLSRRSPLRERAFNRAIETPRPALNSVGCLRLCRDGVNGRRAPRSSLFPHTTVGSAQRHIRLIKTQHRETSMARRLVEREARSGCQPARQHPPVQDLHEFAATASPRRATRCDARVPEQPPVLRQRIQKTRARPLISAALPEAVTTTHPRAPVTREASRHASRYNKRLALPSAPAPCHNSRVMGRPPVPQRTLSSDRPEDRRAVQVERRVELRRRRPGTAPIVVGSRWRVGRPRSRFPRRRRRGLFDPAARRIPIFCERSLQCTIDARNQVIARATAAVACDTRFLSGA